MVILLWVILALAFIFIISGIIFFGGTGPQRDDR
jgi:hypothetical protein